MESLSYAIKNVDWLLANVEFKFEYPELKKSLQLLSKNYKASQEKKSSKKLTVEINSFSFIYMGIPKDNSAHGGGFVFDCRSLSNPGRYPEYVELNGYDEKVISFFKEKDEVNPFMENIYHMTDQVINNYQNRNFTDLMIAFGCTGGQHRSVYCANLLYSYLKTRYNIDLELQHRELETDTDTK